MPFQNSETNATYITFEWTLASMASFVHLQLAPTEKTFAAKVTQILLHSRMNQHVCFQCVTRNEFWIAFSARVAPHGAAFRFVVQSNWIWRQTHFWKRHKQGKMRVVWVENDYRNWFGCLNCAPQSEHTKYSRSRPPCCSVMCIKYISSDASFSSHSKQLKILWTVSLCRDRSASVRKRSSHTEHTNPPGGRWRCSCFFRPVSNWNNWLQTVHIYFTLPS